MKSNMTHDWSRIPQANIERSAFNRDFEHTTTFDSGYLIPIMCDEVLPGDTLNLHATIFCRMSTPMRPIMDNLYLDTFYFFVPCRLVWTNWQHFMGEKEDVDSMTEYLVPYVQPTPEGGWDPMTIYDYFGLPIGIGGEQTTVKCNSLPLRAYKKIWNDWFRAAYIQDAVDVPMDNGPDDSADFALLWRNKRHDYFTSCLPEPQMGEPVEIPIGTSAPVFGNEFALKLWDGTDRGVMGVSGSSPYDLAGNQPRSESVQTGSSFVGASTWSSQKALGLPLKSWYTDNAHSGLYADLSEATASTINDLRTAFAMQKFLERMMRGGTRYTEIIRAHFNVISPDARLQRAEFLGGGHTRIHINPVQQTAPAVIPDATQGTYSSGLGQLGAYAAAVETKSGFVKGFTEHGYVIGLMNVRQDLRYQKGLDRMWSRRTREEFYWPAFAHLGEQAVLNKEIYCQDTADDDLVFGYQERHAEYRYKNSLITGLFRSQAAGTLHIWHLAQNFTTLPVLGDTFLREWPPISRVEQVNGNELYQAAEFIADIYFNYSCVRPMPIYSVPGLIDHF